MRETMCYLDLFFVLVTLLKSLYAQEEIITVEAVMGHSAELPCNVTAENDGDVLKILAWYRDGSPTAFYSRDLRGDGSGVLSPGGRYKLISSEDESIEKLQILNVRPSDVGQYYCFADFESSPTHKTYLRLEVIEPPQRLWVIHENGTRVTTASAGSNNSRNVGPYYVGDTVHLFCVVFGGKPLASLSWWAGHRLLKNTTTPLSEQRVRSDLMYGPLRREDHGLVLTCFAKNNEKTPPLSIDITIDMHLPPELVSVRISGDEADALMSGRVRANELLTLQCRVFGARPLPTVTWRLNSSQLHNLEQNVTMEPSQRLVASEVQLSISPEYDEARVTCCAPANLRGAEQFVCAQGLPLTVLYPPQLQIAVDGELENNTLTAVKGTNILINCSYQANPSVYQVTWFHGDDLVTQNYDHDEATINPTLELKEISETDAGEYVCAATNNEGSAYSETLVVDVTYPAYCVDETIAEYGIAENESINITCNVKANPEPTSYRWAFISETMDANKMRNNQTFNVETEESTLLYKRPNDTSYTLIHCWGLNNVVGTGLPQTKCSFLVTDETVPRPPTNCVATRSVLNDITISCEKGHDGGLQQKFKFNVSSLDSEEQLVSIINQEPKFIIQEPKEENYKFVIVAFNAKGESKIVEIEKDSIIDESEGAVEVVSAVSNITTLALALCGGVLLLALAACGLVLCAHERAVRSDLPPPHHDPPLCAYNTDDTNCETFHDSDDGSEFNVRRTESFRRAMARYPSKNYDVRRTGSFHSARYMHEMSEPESHKCNDSLRYSASCKLHSLQNINKKRDMDVLCDHLVMHLPPETHYNVSKPMNTFYTMPRKMRQKLAKELSDETSEITQTSDGFSLPPPPDEFGTYRAATKIKDMPTKSTPTYTTIVRKNSSGKELAKQPSTLSPMNTVGLPTISGAQNSIYTYPDYDNQGHQINTNPFDDSS
ncbi:unnamed protein product [Parnassius apollo]|uniref:(apollo) hypothetical protein n=1 Tax=Parnassius apollo TaxID=110799 RepID=A0A8S3WVE5_PARAO|nr:unnamed protein product [Parnassius apollo]